MPEALLEAVGFPGPLGPAVVLRLALLGGLCACLVLSLGVGRQRPRTPGLLRTRGLGAAVTLAMLAMLVYQSTWQLAGFARPRFLQFMRRYDRRVDRAADRFTRGRIVDRNGLLLAADEASAPEHRIYTMGEAGAHLIGYRHPLFGNVGLEKTFEPLLSGRDPSTKEHWRQFRRNLLYHDEASGTDLRLTIDARLQQVAQALLTDYAGACVVLDARSSEVLTLVSSPSYDPGALSMESLRKRADSPLFNRALHGLYPPGSAFKIVLAGAAMDAGLEPILDCPASGYLPPGAPEPIRDHEFYEYERRGRVWPGRRGVDLHTALIRSSNVYFARLGAELGFQAFNRVADQALLREAIALTSLPEGPSARSGNVPTLGSGQERNLAQCSIGQGRLLVTPMHMAVIAAAIAADGVLQRPSIIADSPGPVLGQLMSPDSARRLRAILRDNVIGGTGRRADVRGLEVAGKTGTAEAPKGRDHAWFVAMAPATQPRIAVAVVLEHAGYASSTAAPMVAELLNAAWRFGLFEESAGEGAP